MFSAAKSNAKFYVRFYDQFWFHRHRLAVESIRAMVEELTKKFRDYRENKTNSGRKRKTIGITSSAVEKGETKKN